MPWHKMYGPCPFCGAHVRLTKAGAAYHAHRNSAVCRETRMANDEKKKKKTKTKTKLKPLEPADPTQCQVDVPNGHSFMTLGGVPGRVRCTNKPVFIITETKAGADGRKGAMSMCQHCYIAFLEQPGNLVQVDLEAINVESA